MRKVIKLLLSCLGAAAVLVLVLGFFITPKTGSAPNAPVSGTKPFSSSSGIGCNYYRIPALLTTTDGTVLAAIDARFGGTHDSPNNIDTAVSASTDSGKSWGEPQLVFQFDDFENTDDFLKEKQYDLKEEVAVKSDYYLNTNREFEVRCQIMENGFSLIDLKLTVPTEKEAESIAANWSRQSQEIYTLLLSKLL